MAEPSDRATPYFGAADGADRRPADTRLRLGVVGGRPVYLATGPRWRAAVGRPLLAKSAPEAGRG